MTANSAPLRTLLNVFQQLADLNETHPDWMHRFESADFGMDSLNDLIALLQDAPTPLAQGIVAGKLSIVQSMSSRIAAPTLDQRPSLRVVSKTREASAQRKAMAVSPIARAIARAM